MIFKSPDRRVSRQILSRLVELLIPDRKREFLPHKGELSSIEESDIDDFISSDRYRGVSAESAQSAESAHSLLHSSSQFPRFTCSNFVWARYFFFPGSCDVFKPWSCVNFNRSCVFFFLWVGWYSSQGQVPISKGHATSSLSRWLNMHMSTSQPYDLSSKDNQLQPKDQLSIDNTINLLTMTIILFHYHLTQVNQTPFT